MAKNYLLKALRTAKGRNQYDCAQALKISAAQFCRIENGQSQLNENGRGILAKYLGIDPEQLTAGPTADYARVVAAISNSSKPVNRKSVKSFCAQNTKRI